MKAVWFILFLLGSALAESHKLYVSLNSLYGTASDGGHIRDFGAAWETPMAFDFTVVARFRYLSVKQEAWNEEDRNDNIYANTFPAAYRVLGFQASLRSHPWEWMPGFFSEALVGYKNITGGSSDASAGWAMDVFSMGPKMSSFTNHAFESAIGFGYQWELGRLRFDLGFAFGPEFLFRNSVYADGTRQSSDEVVDMLRFNQFEIGVAL